MTTKSKFIWGAVVVVVVSTAVVFAHALLSPKAVSVMTIRPETVEQSLSVVGSARPSDLVEIASPNPGQIIRLLHDDGDTVSAGDLLAVIRATVQQAQNAADLAQERAARAQADEARDNYNRTKTLADKGYAAPAALQSAAAALKAADANVTAASATARASAEHAREFDIVAPMNGIVLVRPIDNGQVVSAGETLFELGSATGVEIRAEADEAYADVIRPGMIARAALSGSNRVFPARVFEVSPKVDAATGGRLIKLTPSLSESLPPGRSVDVTIVIGQVPGAITIPRQAIVDATASPKAYVVSAKGIVEARRIVLVEWPSKDAIVRSGLVAGDRLITAPLTTRVGAHVKPVGPKPPAR